MNKFLDIKVKHTNNRFGLNEQRDDLQQLSETL